MVGSAGDINFSFLVRWLLRHVTRRVILVLICIASITMPFLLLRMKSKTSVEATRQYSVLHEEVKDNIINAYRNDDYEERSRYMSYEQGDITEREQVLSVTGQGRVLIVSKHVETGSKLLQQMSKILDMQKINYKIIDSNNEKIESYWTHQSLSDASYSVIVFDSITAYVGLGRSRLHSLHYYCKTLTVGLLIVPGSIVGKVPTLGLMTQASVTTSRLWINDKSSLLRLVKGGQVLQSTIETVLLVKRRRFHFDSLVTAQISPKVWKPVVIDDKANQVGVRRVVFGFVEFSLWLVKLLFLDMLRSLSTRPLGHMSLDRKILVDIDDIFVAKSGTKFTRQDVEVMVSFQNNMQKKVPGFHFNLGFSGWYYLKSTLSSEQDGDRAIIEKGSNFWWFGHIYNHSQPHLHNTTNELVLLMKANKQFAKMHSIPVIQNYSVSPHHSGVYPVHEPLYNAWRSVWGVRVTSTEEYPHLRPAYNRMGFIYKGISVLPRQTCGLFTHTYTVHDYPGGFQRLVESAEGGDVFFTILNSPVAIFMTHLSNYGNDRLALRWLNMTVTFIQKWTNLRLSTSRPLELAKHYFSLFPEEATTPFWQNPCQDKRHVDIWPTGRTCRLPSVVVVGPQKTGTTALYQFLNLHPDLLSNRLHPRSYEELQFFRNPNYAKGLDWYMSFFPDAPQRKHSNSTALLFEKSANYFDYPLAPKRMSYLLPRAKIVVILVDPIQRAYSWYQHQRAHHEAASNRYSFYNIITLNSSCPDKSACTLKSRCLIPGHYAEHLKLWLTYYKSSQIYLVDGDELVKQPMSAMDKLQKFLHVHRVDYEKLLRYDERKGFFCEARGSSQTKCLGKGKGRSYKPLDDHSRQFLKQYYRQHNIEMKAIMLEHGWTLPVWLQNIE